MAEVKQSINRTQVIGTLKEMNMEEVTKEVTLKKNGVEKKVTCQQIAKKDFKNPMFVIEANGGDIGIDFFPVNEKVLDDNGDITDNSKFKAMQTVMNTYVTKAQDSENATRVKVDGSLRENGYVDGNTFEWKHFPQINGFQITSSSVPEEDSTDSEISGVIRSIIPETKGEDGEETGRLKVELYSFDYNGATSPCTFIVEEDLADDFNSFYENGQSVKLYYEILVKHIGAKKTTGGGFGRRASHMVSGFSVTEFSVFRGDEPFEEENEYYVDIDTMKQAINEREMMIDSKIDEKKNAPKDSKPKASVKSASGGANPFGNGSKPKASPF